MTQELTDAIISAKESLVNYRCILLAGNKDVKPASFHHQWSKDLLNSNENFAWEGFRESAKSQYILRTFPLHALSFPDDRFDFIVIIKENSTMAEAKLKEIEDEYLANPVLSFNLVEVVEKSAAVFCVKCKDLHGVVKTIRIVALGKGAAVRGLSYFDRRPKIVILDDPQGITDARSPSVSDNDWQWFNDDILFLGKDTRFFIISNNIGERCIIERIFANKENMNPKFVCRKIRKIEGGVSTWAEMFPVEVIEQSRLDAAARGVLDIWTMNNLCECISDENREFNVSGEGSDLRYYASINADTIQKDCNIFACLDPASSENKDSCYRAIPIVAVDSKGLWFIIDVRFGRWSSVELIENIFDVAKQYKLYNNKFWAEKGQIQQVLKPILEKEMRYRNHFFDLGELEHARRGSKLERIKMLAPRVKSHSLFLPDNNAPWVSELIVEMAGVTKSGFKSMFVDLLDALAMVEQVAVLPQEKQYSKMLPYAVNEYRDGHGNFIEY